MNKQPQKGHNISNSVLISGSKRSLQYSTIGNLTLIHNLPQYLENKQLNYNFHIKLQNSSYILTHSQDTKTH